MANFEIKTKLDIGQVVFFLCDSQVCKSQVTEIVITYKKVYGDDNNGTYNMEKEIGYSVKGQSIHIEETEIFSSIVKLANYIEDQY